MSPEPSGEHDLAPPRGTCPRCGTAWVGRNCGRPRIWCSQRCRRAAYEERRAAASGAIAVRDVEVTRTADHDLSTCAKRVAESPTAVRRVVRSLGEYEQLTEVASELRWQPTRDALVNLMVKLEREWARNRLPRWR